MISIKSHFCGKIHIRIQNSEYRVYDLAVFVMR